MPSCLMLLIVFPLIQGRYEESQLLKELQGTWSAASAEHHGDKLETITDKNLKVKELQIKIEKKRIFIMLNGEWRPKGEEVEFGPVIDVSKSNIKGIALFGTDVPFIAIRGIYQVSGDELTICYMIAGMQRCNDLPERFVTSKEDNFYLFKFKKVKATK